MRVSPFLSVVFVWVYGERGCEHGDSGRWHVWAAVWS